MNSPNFKPPRLRVWYGRAPKLKHIRKSQANVRQNTRQLSCTSNTQMSCCDSSESGVITHTGCAENTWEIQEELALKWQDWSWEHYTTPPWVYSSWCRTHTDGQQPPNLCGAVTFIQYAYKDQQPNNSFKHSGGFFHKQTTSLTAQQLLSSCSGQVLLLFQTSAERFRVNRLLDYYYQLSTLLVHYAEETWINSFS